MLKLLVLVVALSACSDSVSASTRVWEASTLTEAIQNALGETTIPGAIVGVWQPGQTPYVEAFGVQNIASGKPMTTDLHTRIGSDTKTFIITAVLQLVDQGAIGLDDPIARYVPGVPNGEHVTIRLLAAMRSGLHTYSDDVVEIQPTDPQRQWTPQELLGIAFKYPPLFAPGAEFDYSNTNTVLLGVMIETVTGQRLGEYINQHIVAPVQLDNTVFPEPTEFPAPHPRGYAATPDGSVVDATDWNPSWGWAAGQMVSTVEDLRAWTEALARGQLLTAETQKQRLQFQPAPPEDKGYGLGIENDNGWIGHGGNIFGYLTYPFYLSATETTMVVLFNSSADVAGSVKVMQAITDVISPDNVWPDLPAPPK